MAIENLIVVLIYSCNRHMRNFHGNLNGFSATFSTIFTSYLSLGIAFSFMKLISYLKLI